MEMRDRLSSAVAIKDAIAAAEVMLPYINPIIQQTDHPSDEVSFHIDHPNFKLGDVGFHSVVSQRICKFLSHLRPV